MKAEATREEQKRRGQGSNIRPARANCTQRFSGETGFEIYKLKSRDHSRSVVTDANQWLPSSGAGQRQPKEKPDLVRPNTDI